MGMKGTMVPVKGYTWTMKEPLTLIDFTAPNGLATAPEKWLSALEQALVEHVALLGLGRGRRARPCVASERDLFRDRGR